MKTTCLSLILCLFWSCQSDSSTSAISSNIEDLPLVRKHFSLPEITALATVKTFFEAQICSVAPSDLTATDRSDCYSNYIKKVKYNIENNLAFFDIDYAAYQQLLAKESYAILADNWYQVSDSVRTYSNFSTTGKYFQYLQELSKKDKLVAAYYNRLSRINDVSSPAMWSLMTTPTVFNYDDPNIQFVIAVHYLTWLEDSEVSERYRNLYPDKKKMYNLRNSLRDSSKQQR